MTTDKISFVGLGKLGFCLATCFAEKGITIYAIDKNKELIEKAENNEFLNYEPGLEELYKKTKHKFILSTEYEDAIQNTNTTIILVGTQVKDGYSSEYVKSVLKDFCDTLKKKKKKEYHLLILSSTVMPGESKKYISYIEKKVGIQYGKDFGFAYVPDFVKLGSVVYDFQVPEVFFIGAENQKDFHMTKELYSKIHTTKKDVKRLTIDEAEIAKMTLNSFVLSKISFVNAVSNLCENYDGDVNIDNITNVIKGNKMIAPQFFGGGLSYGGTCLIPETTVLTIDGAKTLDEVEIGEYVFDGKNYTLITGKQERYVDEVKSINCRGRSLIGSLDHIHMKYDNNNLKQCKLKDIKKKDWFCIPKIRFEKPIRKVFMGKKPNGHIKTWHEEIEVNKDIARLIGLYLAEGCSGIYGNGRGDKRTTKTIMFIFGGKEEHFADEIKNILEKININCYKYFKVSENATFGPSRCWTIRARSTWLYDFFEKLNLGHNAHDKRMPILSKEMAKYAIGAWLDGDGTFYKNKVGRNFRLSGFSRSKKMVLDIDSLLLSIGICSAIGRKGQDIGVNCREDIKTVSSWTKRMNTFDSERYKRGKGIASPSCKMDEEENFKVKIYSEETIKEKTRVIAIETESGYYTANNILTHNCLPRDEQAYHKLLLNNGIIPSHISAASDINKFQQKNLFNKIQNLCQQHDTNKVSILGLSFKPNTSVIVESPSFKLIDDLIDSGKQVAVYDPHCLDITEQIYGPNVFICNSVDCCYKMSQIVIIMLDYPEFREINKEWKNFDNHVIFDCWRIIEPSKAEKCGFIYKSIGRSAKCTT